MENKSISFNGKLYLLDGHGFLSPSEQWDENFAEGMAQLLGIHNGLSKEHWDFINYLRKKFLEEKTVPVVVTACVENKLRLSRFRHLFPTGYHRGACKIAGINYEFMYNTNYWLTYETSTFVRSAYRIDSMGFLEDLNQWDRRFAEIIIREWKLPTELTDMHMQVIKYLQDYYKATNNIPTIHEALNANGLDLNSFRELFPEGYRRGACRIAGLPFFP